MSAIELGHLEAIFRYPVKSMTGAVIRRGRMASPPSPVTMPDLRCSIVNLDPDSAKPSPEVMKAVVRANQNYTGIYGAVTRIGRVAVGQAIFLNPPSAVPGNPRPPG